MNIIIVMIWSLNIIHISIFGWRSVVRWLQQINSRFRLLALILFDFSIAYHNKCNQCENQYQRNDTADDSSNHCKVDF